MRYAILLAFVALLSSQAHSQSIDDEDTVELHGRSVPVEGSGNAPTDDEDTVEGSGSGPGLPPQKPYAKLSSVLQATTTTPKITTTKPYAEPSTTKSVLRETNIPVINEQKYATPRITTIRPNASNNESPLSAVSNSVLIGILVVVVLLIVAVIVIIIVCRSKHNKTYTPGVQD